MDKLTEISTRINKETDWYLSEEIDPETGQRITMPVPGTGAEEFCNALQDRINNTKPEDMIPWVPRNSKG